MSPRTQPRSVSAAPQSYGGKVYTLDNHLKGGLCKFLSVRREKCRPRNVNIDTSFSGLLYHITCRLESTRFRVSRPHGYDALQLTLASQGLGLGDRQNHSPAQDSNAKGRKLSSGGCDTNFGVFQATLRKKIWERRSSRTPHKAFVWFCKGVKDGISYDDWCEKLQELGMGYVLREKVCETSCIFHPEKWVKDVVDLFDHLDENKDGVIDFREFCTLMD